MTAGAQIPAAEASATTPGVAGSAGTRLAEAARAAGPGEPGYSENRTAAPGLRGMQEAPQAWAPITRAVNPRSRRLESDSVHDELEFLPQPSDNVVGALWGRGCVDAQALAADSAASPPISGRGGSAELQGPKQPPRDPDAPPPTLQPAGSAGRARARK